MHRRNMFVKLMALVLATITAMMLFAACGEPADPNDTTQTTPADGAITTTTPGDSEATTTAPAASDVETTTPTPVVDLPVVDEKFNSEVVILYWNDVQHAEFDVEELTGDIISDAIHNRNIAVENALGVTLNWVGTPGNYSNQKKFVQTAFNGINSGGEHDIFAGYSMTGATLAVNGHVQNLKSLDYLDFEQPYWPASLINQATINDKLFFASGDISTNMLHMMYTIFFNKQILTDHGLEDPYALVENGTWTYTKMFEMSANLYNDENGDGTRDQGDSYGFCMADNHNYDAFFTAAGLNSVEKDAADQLIISPSYNSEKTVALLEGICTFIWGGQDGYRGADDNMFSKGNTLFTIDRARMPMVYKNEMSFEYGIIPMPKFDEAQKNYVTCLSFPYTMYSISIAAKHTEAAAATLECMAAESYNQVTPVLFEVSMKLKYSSDNQASKMYDIIREGVHIDVGRIFTTELENFSYSTFRNACSKNAVSSWASAYKGTEKMMTTLLKKINDAISKLD